MKLFMVLWYMVINYLWYIFLFKVCKIIYFSEGFSKISQKNIKLLMKNISTTVSVNMHGISGILVS